MLCGCGRHHCGHTRNLLVPMDVYLICPLGHTPQLYVRGTTLVPCPVCSLNRTSAYWNGAPASIVGAQPEQGSLRRTFPNSPLANRA